MVPLCEEAFKKAKESLSSSHVLLHHNGDEKPIAYARRSLISSETNYSQIEKEGLAIIFSVTKYYMYLFGRKFTLRTDHKPLLKIFSPDSVTPVLRSCVPSALVPTPLNVPVRYNSSRLLKSPALMPCPNYHCRYRKNASEDKILQVSAAQLCKHPVSCL